MQQAIAIPEPETLAASARRMLAAGRPAAARPLLAALARVAPQSAALVELGSAAAAAAGELERAIAILDAGVEVTPRDALLRKRRAGLRHRTGDLAGALGDAAEAVIAAPSDASAKALLGLLLIEAGEIARARVCLAEAVATEPDNASFRIGLGEAVSRAGDAEAARFVLDEGIAHAPGRVDLRVAAIRLALGRGDAEAAQGLAEAARAEGVANAVVLRMLAQAAAARGRDEDAAAALASAWKLDPTDPGLRHFAATAGLLPPAERAPIESVRERFNEAAGSFERDMIRAGNRVPGLLRAAVLAHARRAAPGRVGPVLDLGCGSGSAAVALSDLALGPFVGVDVAGAMLALAHARGLYSELREMDLMAFLAEDRRCFPLILAADVLSGFGALAPVFAAVAARLAPGGAFMVSLDAMPAEGAAEREWMLCPDGRYVHGQSAVEGAARAAGLVPRSIHAEPLRNENGRPIAGMIVALGRAADGC